MRPSIATITVGLIAGVAGAVCARQWPAGAPAPSATVSSTREPPSARIVPPGWDRRYVDRLAAVEDRVRALGAGRAEPPVEAGSSSVREQEREARYRRDLEYQHARVEGHAGEAVDPAWSRAQTGALRSELAPMLARGELVAEKVDCRSKTCVATLTFPSPSDALAFLASPSLRTLGRELRGLTSTPAPPSSAGAYDLTIVLDR
jgi:hypothetical protein